MQCHTACAHNSGLSTSVRMRLFVIEVMILSPNNMMCDVVGQRSCMSELYYVNDHLYMRLHYGACAALCDVVLPSIPYVKQRFIQKLSSMSWQSGREVSRTHTFLSFIMFDTTQVIGSSRES